VVLPLLAYLQIPEGLVDEAASDAKGIDVASRDEDSDVDAHDDTDDDAEGDGQPKKVGEYGGRGVRVATAPYDS
jgi:hypothetical protein